MDITVNKYTKKFFQLYQPLNHIYHPLSGSNKTTETNKMFFVILNSILALTTITHRHRNMSIKFVNSILISQ